ncbi:MAG: nucleoside phosphorylase [Proteobacteria bacterium]|nr:nucleoside phosphorylase [Pseudomonadota bacterium]
MGQEIDANILIHPRKGKKEKNLPENGILLVNPSEASLCHQQLKRSGGESRHLFNSDLTVAASHSFFSSGPAIGAPMAAMSMEKLISLGAKKIILFGWCGALSRTLKVGDILLPHEAKSGEGTSRYYPLPTPAAPSTIFRSHIEKSFCDNDMIVHSGCVWSTDAVYREDRGMLQELNSRDGVSAVDMEFSALCSVACFRNIEFAAVLIVSDELWGTAWKPGFSSDIFVESKSKALEIVLACIDSLGE